ncbi:hypothetical protein SEUCBS140593_002826 [Sporothrix eucalyptigena]|uniref:Uncharacterized protein n=1 Tax=Sporothrix eucalyptigena TaxID=1812306 RepID=A0ABP0B9R4_9PEZI
MASMDFTVYMDGMLYNMEDSILQESHEGIMEHISRHSRRQSDAWACELCEQVHKINEEDLPLASGMDSVYGREHSAKVALNCASNSKTKTMITHVSGISHRHIQMALKLTRLTREGRSSNRAYLRKLTVTYAMDQNSMSRTHQISLEPRSDGLANSFTPRIVKDADGSLRFLLQTVYQIGDDAATSINFCPHTKLTSPRQLASSLKLSSGRCKNCSTSYVISASQVRVFEDFGTEGSPVDLHWQAHLNSKVKSHSCRRVRFANGETMEAQFDGPKSSCVAETVTSYSDRETRMRIKMRSVMSKVKEAVYLSFDF